MFQERVDEVEEGEEKNMIDEYILSVFSNWAFDLVLADFLLIKLTYWFHSKSIDIGNIISAITESNNLSIIPPTFFHINVKINVKPSYSIYRIRNRVSARSTDHSLL